MDLLPDAPWMDIDQCREPVSPVFERLPEAPSSRPITPENEGGGLGLRIPGGKKIPAQIMRPAIDEAVEAIARVDPR